MSYKTKWCHGLLWGVVLSGTAMSASADPQARISTKTIELYKSNIKNCRGYNQVSGMADYYIDSIREEINFSKNLKSVQPSYLDQRLSGLFGCDKTFVKNFKKSLANDNMEYHKFSRDQIKKEIKEFEDRGLTGNHLLSSYIEYSKNNEVDLVDDPDMDKMYLKKKAEAKKRKESCSDKMNIKEPLSVERPRNQDSIGWCYAFTAADLMSQALGKEVSPVHTAAMYNNQFMNRLLNRKEGGFTNDALDELIDHGVCLEKDMPSEDYNFSRYEGGTIGSLFREVKVLNDKYSPKTSPKISPDKKIEIPDKGYSKQQVFVDLCTENQNTLIQLAEVFPNLTLEKLAEVLMKSGNNAFQDLAKTCPIDLDPELKNLVVKKVSNNKQIYVTIDEQLEKGNIVGIEYRSDMLENYKENGWTADHASSIVGRRFNEKTLSCEYMLRNSWGTSCQTYAKEYECRNGHAWVGEEFFKYNKSIDRAIYVEKK